MRAQGYDLKQITTKLVQPCSGKRKKALKKEEKDKLQVQMFKIVALRVKHMQEKEAKEAAKQAGQKTEKCKELLETQKCR